MPGSAPGVTVVDAGWFVDPAAHEGRVIGATKAPALIVRAGPEGERNSRCQANLGLPRAPPRA